MGNQTMAVQYNRTHEAMAQAGLFEEIDDCDTEEIDDGFSPVPKKVKPSLLRAQAKRDFDDYYLPALVELRRWISNIQHANITMEHIDCLFKAMLASEKLSGQSAEFEAHLQPDHNLVTSPHFEMGVVKIMKGMSELLTEEEQDECECMLKTEWPELYPIDDEDALNTDSKFSPSSFKRLMASSHKRPHSETALKSKYIDLSFLSPTTVIVESLFSKCSRVITANWKHMMPCLFEALVCLRANKDWWDVHLVQDMGFGMMFLTVTMGKW
jgi:hypothetical protein